MKSKIKSVFQGVCEGATFPALHPMTARWVPVEDRNRDDKDNYTANIINLLT